MNLFTNVYLLSFLAIVVLIPIASTQIDATPPRADLDMYIDEQIFRSLPEFEMSHQSDNSSYEFQFHVPIRAELINDDLQNVNKIIFGFPLSNINVAPYFRTVVLEDFNINSIYYGPDPDRIGMEYRLFIDFDESTSMMKFFIDNKEFEFESFILNMYSDTFDFVDPSLRFLIYVPYDESIKNDRDFYHTMLHNTTLDTFRFSHNNNEEQTIYLDYCNISSVYEFRSETVGSNPPGSLQLQFQC